MFISSSLSPLSSIYTSFCQARLKHIKAVDHLWALESVAGAIASASYVDALTELERRKVRNDIKGLLCSARGHDTREALRTLYVAFQERMPLGK